MQKSTEELFHKIKKAIAGDVRYDLTTRLLYSTDASIYKIEPLGVVFPRDEDDLSACVNLAAEYQTPVIARGAGTGLGGQAIGAGIIIDTSRYLNRILEMNAQERTITVEPGLGLFELNRAAAEHDLMFAPDPASADRATVGGCIANNAAGAHSITYGMAIDHVVSADVVLGDGRTAHLAAVPLAEARRRAESDGESAEANLYRAALEIRQNSHELICRHWPKVWRTAAGYALNYLLPWSSSKPPQWYGNDIRLPYPPMTEDTLNLACLMAGSEGTLGVIKQIKLGLVPGEGSTILGIFAFDSIEQACEATPQILEYAPKTVELIPANLIQLVGSIPAYAHQLAFLPGGQANLLAVEFSELKVDQLQRCAIRLRKDVQIIRSPVQQKQVWEVRKMGLGIFQSKPGDAKTIACIEDLSVPVANLAQFVREIKRITAENGTSAIYYAHASAGCLHIRPLINLKIAEGVKALRQISEQAIALTLSLGGSVSGEHGLGIARSEWLERQYGSEIVALFRRVKNAADPGGILNPGKILDAHPMDSHLRYGQSYATQGWRTVLDLSNQGGLAGAIEMCNGAGVCRQTEGVMCPSFQVTMEEIYSTRGRANLLRAMISQGFPSSGEAERAVFEALDLCLACKGCKSECPSGVDIARLKYEYFNHYYRSHPRKLRDYLFGYIGWLAPLGSLFASVVNTTLGWKVIQKMSEGILGLSSSRTFPAFASWRSNADIRHPKNPSSPELLLLTDTFSRYFHPETEKKTLQVIKEIGMNVQVIPLIGAGRTLISKGFLEPARSHANHVVESIKRIDPEGKLPVVGIEPSEIYSLRDEYLDFFPGDAYIEKLAQRAWMIDEFLLRIGENGRPRYEKLAKSVGEKHRGKQVLLHGHCYQKARPPADDGFPVGVNASVELLNAFGYQVEVIDAGCCGMAGAFGYEKEHYTLSMAVGEQKLFPRIREASPDAILAACGTSCRSQIQDGVGRDAVHPICLI
ncbi:MAG: FAD-binding protein [Anaerolineales bacterium]|nr:FAD-binding protein [Anaerolineales bacterium]